MPSWNEGVLRTRVTSLNGAGRLGVSALAIAGSGERRLTYVLLGTTIKARILLTIEDDGSAAPWRGMVFVNPPYGRALKLWISKCAGVYALRAASSTNPEGSNAVGS